MFYKIVTSSGIEIRCDNISHCRFIIDYFGLSDFQVMKVYPECKGHGYFEYLLPTSFTRSFDKYLISKGCKVVKGGDSFE